MQLRRKGKSIRFIEETLGIPRSTLSGWLRAVQLTAEQNKILENQWKDGLKTARQQAVKWHNAQKKARHSLAKDEAESVLRRFKKEDTHHIELALSFLYLGEGAKSDTQTALGNSDPRILKFFITALYRVYGLKPLDMKCHLHLRADQDPIQLTRYWSRTLGIPRKNFGKPSLDQRTAGRPTYPDYKGVCLVSCARVAIQRRLMYIANGFCESIS